MSPQTRTLSGLEGLLNATRKVHDDLRGRAVRALESDDEASLRHNFDDGAGDTVYGIDRVSESELVSSISQHMEPWLPLILIAEGLPDSGLGLGIQVVPSGADPASAKFQMIVDPIDGTRGLMYGKRSAWILTGFAPNDPLGIAARLDDIEAAMQTEIPPPKQTLADRMWAIRGHGASAERTNLANGETKSIAITPSRATTLAHGFGQVARVFPGGRDILARIDDEICFAADAYGTNERGVTFEDQYISTGGQIAELLYGHDRWVADLRPFLSGVLKAAGLPLPQCCHPYDICTLLIAREAGVQIDLLGSNTNPPLRLEPNVAWAGYANARIRQLVEPVLLEAISRNIGSEALRR